MQRGEGEREQPVSDVSAAASRAPPGGSGPEVRARRGRAGPGRVAAPWAESGPAAPAPAGAGRAEC